MNSCTMFNCTIRCLLILAIISTSLPGVSARASTPAASLSHAVQSALAVHGLRTAGRAAALTPAVQPGVTPEWMNFYGLRAWVDGQLAPAGAVVEARTPAGLPCGQTTVETPGQFGLLTVYRDDPATAEVEGGDLAKPFLLWLTTGRRPLTTNGL